MSTTAESPTTTTTIDKSILLHFRACIAQESVKAQRKISVKAALEELVLAYIRKHS